MNWRLTSLKWSKSALFPIKYADGPFCNDLKLANKCVAYLKLNENKKEIMKNKFIIIIKNNELFVSNNIWKEKMKI